MQVRNSQHNSDLRWNRQADIPALYLVQVKRIQLHYHWQGEVHPLPRGKSAVASKGLLRLALPLGRGVRIGHKHWILVPLLTLLLPTLHPLPASRKRNGSDN